MPTFYENRKMSFDFFYSDSLSFPTHLHKQLELLYVLDGSITVTINGIQRTLHKGELSIAFPHSTHSYSPSPISQIFLVIFDAELTQDFALRLMSLEPLSPFLKPEQVHRDVIYCIDSIGILVKEQLDIKLVKGYLSIMIYHILENLPLKSGTLVDHSNLTHQMLVYISEHFKEPITLESIAKGLGASKYHLSRIFSGKLNINFNTYLNSLRIGLAQHLLQQANLTVTEVAFECGFDSSRTFYRAFRQICQMTPSEYKKKLNQSY